MDSRALFYRQLYETLKGELQKQGIKALGFHNRRLTQMEPQMDADKPFETLKGEFPKQGIKALGFRPAGIKPSGFHNQINEINQINQIGHKQKEVKGKLKTNNQWVKTNKKGGKKCGRR